MTTEQKDHLAVQFISIADLLKHLGYTSNEACERFEKWGSSIPFKFLTSSSGLSVRGFLDLAEKKGWITWQDQNGHPFAKDDLILDKEGHPYGKVVRVVNETSILVQKH